MPDLQYSKYLKTIMILAALISWAFPLKACTIWGATGKQTQNAVTLVAKNDDKKPDNRFTLTMYRPKNGYPYVAIFSDSKKSGGVKGGINQEGLVIVSASAPPFHGEDPEIKKRINFNKQVLANYNSVDSVLKDKALLSHLKPCYFLLGDRNKIALLEIAPREQHSVDVTEDGVLCHTNHYLGKEVAKFNKTKNKNSHIRFDRIKHLLKAAPTLNMEQFIRFSEDKNDGPDNSIWRTGSTPDKARTLASFIVAIPKNGSPEIRFKFANPNEKEKSYKLKLDNQFWAKGSFTL